MKKPVDPVVEAIRAEQAARQMRWHAVKSRETAAEFDRWAELWETRATKLRGEDG